MVEGNDSLGARLQTLEERVAARLTASERETRRLRGRLRLTNLAIVVLLALVGVLTYRPGWLRAPGLGMQEVRTGSLVLVDGVGRSRGQWSLDDEGNSRLTLLDDAGQVRLRLSVLEDGSPGMSLISAEGNSRAAFGLLPDQTTTLVFADASGVARAVLGLTGDQGASLVFADAQGVSKVGLGVDGTGMGSALLPLEDEVEISDSTQGPGGS
jgi:hypothetical protein